MDKKFPMTAGKPEGITVHLDGLPDLVAIVADLQNQIDLLQSFVEDVFKMVLIPDQVHYYLMDKYEDVEYAVDALDGLGVILSRYRKMLAFLQKNGINPEQVFGEDKSKPIN